MLLPSQKPAKAFFLLFCIKICLRHQSVTPFLSGTPPCVAYSFIHDFEHFSEQSNSVVATVVRYPSWF